MSTIAMSDFGYCACGLTWCANCHWPRQHHQLYTPLLSHRLSNPRPIWALESFHVSIQTCFLHTGSYPKQPYFHPCYARYCTYIVHIIDIIRERRAGATTFWWPINAVSRIVPVHHTNHRAIKSSSGFCACTLFHRTTTRALARQNSPPNSEHKPRS